ncbi:MAG: hypothetical protein HYT71_01465 [Candidatus Aenigmarchaeota archaeon]|nr:hypothetical protein [Candidatus Aenigmarchaeota archaeon]
MKTPTVKTSLFVLSSIFVMFLFSFLAYSGAGVGSSMVADVSFTADETSQQKQAADSFNALQKYKPDQQVLIKVRGSVVGSGSIWYMGVGLVKTGDDKFVYKYWVSPSGGAVDTSSAVTPEALAKCPGDGKDCTMTIKLPGTASQYAGMEVIPFLSGFLDGKQTSNAQFGSYYVIRVQGAVVDLGKLGITVPNEKPTVTVKAERNAIYTDEKVKIMVEAKASDGDIRSISVDVPTQANSKQIYDCNNKERSLCKHDFLVPLKSVGDLTVMAKAVDLRDSESDSNGVTISVQNRVSVVEGFNTFVVGGSSSDGALFRSWLSMKQDENKRTFGTTDVYLWEIPGATQCGWEQSTFAALGSNFVWKRIDMLYKLNSDDKALAVYCVKSKYVYSGSGDEDY